MPSPTPSAAPKKRQTRSPAQRAQDALDVVDRQIAAVHKKITAAKAAVTEVEKELPVLEKRRAYLAANPDLPAPAGGKPEPAPRSDG